MCNSINIPELMLQDADIGERVTLPITGLVQEDENGNRYIEVLKLDGTEVEDMDDSDYHDGKMDSDDALTLFIGKINKDKRKKA